MRAQHVERRDNGPRRTEGETIVGRRFENALVLFQRDTEERLEQRGLEMTKPTLPWPGEHAKTVHRLGILLAQMERGREVDPITTPELQLCNPGSN